MLWSSNDFSKFLWTRSESLCSVLSLTVPQQVQSPQLTLLTFTPYFSVWNVFHEHPTILLGSSGISIWCFQGHNHNKIIELSAGYCLSMHTHRTHHAYSLCASKSITICSQNVTLAQQLGLGSRECSQGTLSLLLAV